MKSRKESEEKEDGGSIDGSSKEASVTTGAAIDGEESPSTAGSVSLVGADHVGHVLGSGEVQSEKHGKKGEAEETGMKEAVTDDVASGETLKGSIDGGNDNSSPAEKADDEKDEEKLREKAVADNTHEKSIITTTYPDGSKRVESIRVAFDGSKKIAEEVICPDGSKIVTLRDLPTSYLTPLIQKDIGSEGPVTSWSGTEKRLSEGGRGGAHDIPEVISATSEPPVPPPVILERDECPELVGEGRGRIHAEEFAEVDRGGRPGERMPDARPGAFGVGMDPGCEVATEEQEQEEIYQEEDEGAALPAVVVEERRRGRRSNIEQIRSMIRARVSASDTPVVEGVAIKGETSDDGRDNIKGSTRRFLTEYRCWIIGVLLLLLIALATALGVVLPRRSRQEDDAPATASQKEDYPEALTSTTAMPTLTSLMPMPTNLTTAVANATAEMSATTSTITTSTSTSTIFYNMTEIAISISGADAVLLSGTPQSEALYWLLHNDTWSRSSASAEEILQRYVMLVFYFSLGGEFWNIKSGWPHGSGNIVSHVCTWYGISCNPSLGTSEGATTITKIDFDDNSLDGTIPEEMGHLSSLEALHLLYNPNLWGSIPTTITHLTNLRSLKLDINDLTGTLPEDIGKLTKLEHLSFIDTIMNGPIPETIGGLAKLKTLNLLGPDFEYGSYTHAGFTGTLPAQSVGKLEQLTWLSLGSNRISGSIPTEICLLTNLRHMSMGRNRFDGNIPTCIGALTELRVLDLWRNSISGSIPRHVNDLVHLTTLELGGNELNSTIPPIGNLGSLQLLHLGVNNLSGEIPTSLINLTKLHSLYLGRDDYSRTDKVQTTVSSGNNLDSTIPQLIGNLKHLEMLDMSSNMFSGSIPTSLYELTNLISLDLEYNNLNGMISDQVESLSSLRFLYLRGNLLSGSIGKGICALTALEALWLGNIYGTQHCRIHGTLPSELGNLSALRRFNVRRCSLTGPIPSSVGNLASLEYFEMDDNFITGILPHTIGNMSSLRHFLVSHNWLHGPLPPSLGQLKQLESFFASENELNSTLPQAIGFLPRLERLFLGNNLLSGSIPEASIGLLTSLRDLDLSDNKLDGEIPESLGGLKRISSLKLERNNFWGRMPDSVCALQEYDTFGFGSPRIKKDFSADCGGGKPQLACCCCKECCQYDVHCVFQMCPFDGCCNEPTWTRPSTTSMPETVTTIKPNSSLAGLEQCPSRKLFAKHGRTLESFGHSVDVEGNTIIIGIPSDDINGPMSGSARVFSKIGAEWVEQDYLVPSDGEDFKQFGVSVATDGSTTIIGADNHYSDNAYVFTLSGGKWQEEALLQPREGVSDWYGVSVAMHNNTALIGTPSNNETGTAFVFARTNGTWDQVATLIPSDGEDGAWFGSSVAIDRDTAIIGASSDRNSVGAAYVFVREGGEWNQQAKLRPRNRTISRNFGTSVSLDGNWLIVGSPDGWESQQSSVHVFRRVNARWRRRGELQPPMDESDDSGFGTSVALNAKTAVVGNYRDGKNGWLSGAAHVFKRSGLTWQMLATLRPRDAEGYDLFGSSVAVSGEIAVVGAKKGDNDKGKDSGVVHVLELC